MIFKDFPYLNQFNSLLTLTLCYRWLRNLIRFLLWVMNLPVAPGEAASPVVGNQRRCLKWEVQSGCLKMCKSEPGERRWGFSASPDLFVNLEFIFFVYPKGLQVVLFSLSHSPKGLLDFSCRLREGGVLTTSPRKPAPGVCQISLAECVQSTNCGREGWAWSRTALTIHARGPDFSFFKGLSFFPLRLVFIDVNALDFGYFQGQWEQKLLSFCPNTQQKQKNWNLSWGFCSRISVSHMTWKSWAMLLRRQNFLPWYFMDSFLMQI